MKKTMYIVIALFLISTIVTSQSLNENVGKTLVTIIESEDTYQILAVYYKSKTNKVQGYIDKRIKSARIDATLTLDDKITFYIKAIPGELKIVFDKKKYPPASYTKIKKLGEGIKAMLEER